MNSFLFSAITIGLVAQYATAHYQPTPASSYGYQPQRKLAPTPQTYVPQQQQQQSYAPVEQQQYEPSGYQMEQSAYGAKSSAAGGSSYGSAEPASSYGKQAASYSRQASAPAASYGGSSSYAKPAPKYEEPYYPPMPFAWGYDINDGYGGAQYHKENGDEYGKRTGSYGYTDAYGIYRQVDYVADEHGFRATIKTNEPGTANESPASVDLHAYEPPSNYYAGASSSYGSGSGTGKGGYAAAASAPAASYRAKPQQQQQSSYSASAAASGYSQPQQQASYRAPAATAAAAPAYQTKSAAPRQQAYNEAAQYLSSVIVPVYQKQTAKPAVAKRVY